MQHPVFDLEYTSPAERHNEVLDVIMSLHSLIHPLCVEEGESVCLRAVNLTTSLSLYFFSVHQYLDLSLFYVLTNPNPESKN